MIRVARVTYQYPLTANQARVIMHYDIGQLVRSLLYETVCSSAFHGSDASGSFIEFELDIMHDNDLVRASVMRLISDRIKYCFEQQMKWEGEATV